MICKDCTTDTEKTSSAKWEIVCRNKVKCSACGRSRNTDIEMYWNYCPHCGKKMVGDINRDL
jgi:predicted RNA-binding Zn-ribbon protein involved in translation (DUF1610 family)